MRSNRSFCCCKQDAVDKKALEDRIITLSRSALKPHYHGGRITAQEYKTIMKKAINKVCVGCFFETLDNLSSVAVFSCNMAVLQYTHASNFCEFDKWQVG